MSDPSGGRAQKRNASPLLFSQPYKRYVLGACTLVYTLNYLDQGLIALLLQPIKEDLHLSDTQLGFVTGIAFALFYAVLGVPIARWADRANRVTITSLAIALWGGTVMACLYVGSFVQLVLARVAAAVGEAGCMPPTYSLVGDYFPEPAERTRAMAIYMLAGPLAGAISFVVGGWLNDAYGWRYTFFVMGLPGLLTAILVKVTIKEPRVIQRGAHEESTELAPVTGGVVAVLLALWRQSSTRNLSLAIVLVLSLAAGMAPWQAAFMMRNHGMQTSELGVWMGLMFAFGGTAGSLLGGYVGSHWFARDERSLMRLNAVTVAALVPCFLLFLFLPQKTLALLALVPLMMGFNFFIGPSFALLQRLVADEMRATTLSVVMLLTNLIGMGAGPQIVGILSDWLHPRLGPDSLRYAMLVESLVALWAAWHFWRVGRTLTQDLTAMGAARDAPRAPTHVIMKHQPS
jgi:MFS family permease